MMRLNSVMRLRTVTRVGLGTYAAITVGILSCTGLGCAASAHNTPPPPPPAAATHPEAAHPAHGGQQSDTTTTTEDSGAHTEAHDPSAHPGEVDRGEPPPPVPAPSNAGQEEVVTETARQSGSPMADIRSLRRVLSDRETDLDNAIDQALDAPLASTSPGCERARRARDQICELASSICRIAGRHDSFRANRRCEDSRERCERATERVSEVCD